MPRSDEEALGLHERFDPWPVGGSFLQVVLNRDGLSVECERAELPVALEDVKEARHHRDEPRAVTLEALVPLAVPVRVRDHECAPPEPAPQKRDGARREKARGDANGHPAKHIEGVMDPDDDAREGRGGPEEKDRCAIFRGHLGERDGGSHCQGGVARRERERRGVRDHGLRCREEARRVRERVKRARPPDDQLQDLGEPPRGEHREDDRAGRRDPAPVQAARAKEKERQDPPEEAVPVQIRERDGDDRGDEVSLRRDREVELGVEVPERGEKIVQRERTWRQTNSATPTTIRPATM